MRKKALFIGTVIGLGILLTSCAKRQPYKADIQEQFTEFFSTKIIGVEVVDNDLRIMLNNKIFFDIIREEVREAHDRLREKYDSLDWSLEKSSDFQIDGLSNDYGY